MIEERPCARMFCFFDRFASKNVGGGSGRPGKIQFMTKTWSGEYKLHPRSPFARHVSQNHPRLAGTGIFLGDRSLQICFSFLKLPTSPSAKACIITQKFINIFIQKFLLFRLHKTTQKCYNSQDIGRGRKPKRKPRRKNSGG